MPDRESGGGLDELKAIEVLEITRFTAVGHGSAPEDNHDGWQGILDNLDRSTRLLAENYPTTVIVAGRPQRIGISGSRNEVMATMVLDSLSISIT